MLTTTQAFDILRLDEDANSDLVHSLVEAIPPYIELSTGLSTAQQDAEPMCYALSKVLLSLWYYGDKADAISLTRIAESLQKAIGVKYE